MARWVSFGSLAIAFFLLPVEEKVIAGLPGNARDGLFPLPVKEKVLSRLAGWLAGWLAGRPPPPRKLERIPSLS